MEIIKSELHIEGEEKLNKAVAKELFIPDPENADQLLDLQAHQIALIDPEILEKIKQGIPMEELGRRTSFSDEQIEHIKEEF